MVVGVIGLLLLSVPKSWATPSTNTCALRRTFSDCPGCTCAVNRIAASWTPSCTSVSRSTCMTIVRANDDGPASGGVSTSSTLHAANAVTATAASIESFVVRMMMSVPTLLRLLIAKIGEGDVHQPSDGHFVTVLITAEERDFCHSRDENQTTAGNQIAQGRLTLHCMAHEIEDHADGTTNGDRGGHRAVEAKRHIDARRVA